MVSCRFKSYIQFLLVSCRFQCRWKMLPLTATAGWLPQRSTKSQIPWNLIEERKKDLTEPKSNGLICLLAPLVPAATFTNITCLVTLQASLCVLTVFLSCHTPLSVFCYTTIIQIGIMSKTNTFTGERKLSPVILTAPYHCLIMAFDY